MSYKQDIRFFKEQQRRRKATLTQLIKITVLTLAAAILLTAVATLITALTGGFHTPDESDGIGFIGPKGNRISLMLGQAPTYKQYVTLQGEGAKITSVDSSEVDVNTAGRYRVYYTATNASGEKAQYTLTLIISANPSYTVEHLMNLIADKADELGITSSMGVKEKVRRIYTYVRDPEASGDEARISLESHSNAGGQKNQTGIRTDWKNDWVEEAILTLELIDRDLGAGDCYSYYALSKAFFEYFDIEHVGIQRSADSGVNGTHFWLAVNVGTKDDPAWYYYDATRLAGRFSSDNTASSCLITEEKLLSYKTTRGESGFYTFDKSQYENFPQIETTPLS